MFCSWWFPWKKSNSLRQTLPGKFWLWPKPGSGKASKLITRRWLQLPRAPQTPPASRWNHLGACRTHRALGPGWPCCTGCPGRGLGICILKSDWSFWCLSQPIISCLLSHCALQAVLAQWPQRMRPRPHPLIKALLYMGFQVAFHRRLWYCDL